MFRLKQLFKRSQLPSASWQKSTILTNKTQTDKDGAKANFARINNACDLFKEEEWREAYCDLQLYKEFHKEHSQDVPEDEGEEAQDGSEDVEDKTPNSHVKDSPEVEVQEDAAPKESGDVNKETPNTHPDKSPEIEVIPCDWAKMIGNNCFFQGPPCQMPRRTVWASCS